MMKLGWYLERSHNHTLLQKQMELMKAVCLPPIPSPLCCTPLAPHYSLPLCDTMHLLIMSVFHRSCNCASWTSYTHIAIFISYFKKCLRPFSPTLFHKIILTWPDIILEAETIKLIAFVHKERKDNNTTYHGKGTALDYFLQMYS